VIDVRDEGIFIAVIILSTRRCLLSQDPLPGVSVLLAFVRVQVSVALLESREKAGTRPTNSNALGTNQRPVPCASVALLAGAAVRHDLIRYDDEAFDLCANRHRAL
jgi:hypothetical protein